MTTQPQNLIPVDAVILYRTEHSNDFHSCHVLNVSHEAVHILLDQPLNHHTNITFMVQPEGFGQQPYYVLGEVKKRGLQDGGWLHEVTASSNRPWSPMFLYDVLCTNGDFDQTCQQPDWEQATSLLAPDSIAA